MLRFTHTRIYFYNSISTTKRANLKQESNIMITLLVRKGVDGELSASLTPFRAVNHCPDGQNAKELRTSQSFSS